MAIRWLIIDYFCELLGSDKNNTLKRTLIMTLQSKSYEFLLYK